MCSIHMQWTRTFKFYFLSLNSTVNNRWFWNILCQILLYHTIKNIPLKWSSFSHAKVTIAFKILENTMHMVTYFCAKFGSNLFSRVFGDFYFYFICFFRRYAGKSTRERKKCKSYSRAKLCSPQLGYPVRLKTAQDIKSGISHFLIFKIHEFCCIDCMSYFVCLLIAFLVSTVSLWKITIWSLLLLNLFISLFTYHIFTQKMGGQESAFNGLISIEITGKKIQKCSKTKT